MSECAARPGRLTPTSNVDPIKPPSPPPKPQISTSLLTNQHLHAPRLAMTPQPPSPVPSSLPPLHTDLIFPSQPSLSALLATLKRSTLSIHNRLASIRADAQFVARAAAALASGAADAGGSSVTPQDVAREAQPRARRRPLVANERCGSWYVPPGDKAASAYFKSTDGHERAWKFSTRRLNLHLVDMIEKNDG
ncbi:tRNA A64-2'-O-ribosylphosphate transferase [Tolypocladium ophioglossoides CBS 100239]|uniref:tRNA A64-2'-O-ribosylphosphate transferase n=1 Tax=Tolypocladium ophioglossoides (strain CBS 100239) TaxID=1163406 RepID=A0A0L0NH73_TOLOC|nr:tRNA A64-2'-O-ribosylphosphate transferase [Tolypocladium ophioglossoides CBS 100239]